MKSVAIYQRIFWARGRFDTFFRLLLNTMALKAGRRGCNLLVAYPEHDGCELAPPRDLPLLMEKRGKNSKPAFITIKGSQNTGDLCEARAYHGINGIEPEVVGKIGSWMVAAKL